MQRDEITVQYSMAIKRDPSPSDSVKRASTVKDATIDRHGPRYGRPSHRFEPPTSLFSEPPALLEYKLGHLESYTPGHEMLDRVFSLITSSTDFFGDEDKRERELREALGNLPLGQGKWQNPTPGKTAEPDTIWLEGPFVYLIIELKNEPRLAGDPFLQTLVSWQARYGRQGILWTLPNNLSADSYHGTTHTSTGPVFP